MAVSLWKERPRGNLSNYPSCRIQQAVFWKSLYNFESVVLKGHFLASTIENLYWSHIVGWLDGNTGGPTLLQVQGFPSHTMVHLNPWRLPHQSPYVRTMPQRSSVWSRRLSDDDFDFLRGKRAFWQRSTEKVYWKSTLSTCLTSFKILSEKGINHKRTSPLLCMRCI